MGTTLASFHSLGTLPVLYDILNNKDKGYDKLTAQYFKILPCIPSGPLALFELILDRSFRMLRWQNEMSNSLSLE